MGRVGEVLIRTWQTADKMKRQRGRLSEETGDNDNAPMGDPNASIPTPQPVHYRHMFGALGGALAASSATFVSQAAIDNNLGESLGLAKSLVAVSNTRGGTRQWRAAYLRACRGATACATLLPVLNNERACLQ